MADGVDRIAGLAALSHGVQVYCCYPYKKKIRTPWEEYITDNAINIRYANVHFEKDCFFKRDRFIVDQCDLLLVVWDGEKIGGSWYTYNYAKKQGKNVLLFPWIDEEESGE